MTRTKLELTWTNKDKVLLRLDKHGEPVWGTWNDVDTRLLIEQARYGNPDAENILIKGNNLLALQALLPQFASRIKLIYIDPPFNTGSAFQHYDDGFEHTIWLSLMRDRLKLLHKLLRDDGAIFVHIDDNEIAYLRILLDEVFGRANFRNTIITKRIKKSIRERDRVLSVNTGHDTILFYAKSADHLITPPTKREVKKARWHALDAPGIRTGMDYELFGFRPPEGRHWMFSKERAQQMIQEGTLRPNPRTGKPQYLIPPSEEILCDTIWNDISSYSFRWDFQTEKSEALLKRIIEMATNDSDWVLDSFGGSGTTGAVAHQLGRKWIMVEIGEHADTHIIPRMQRIINGEKPYNKAYGGGFTYYTLGESVVGRDTATGVWVLNYSNGPLIEAVCLREGFQIIADGDLHGRKGHHYAHITEEYVTQEYANGLLAQLEEHERLTIYCTWHDRHLSSTPSGRVRIAKIPRALLQEGGRR